jgi:hypothetical protein
VQMRDAPGRTRASTASTIRFHNPPMESDIALIRLSGGLPTAAAPPARR